jgi:hypothetical protein
MKKERKLKLVINKVKISNLHGVYGGTGSATDSRVDTCVVPTDISCVLTCDDTGTAIDISDPCQTGDTKSERSLRNCFNSEGC